MTEIESLKQTIEDQQRLIGKMQGHLERALSAMIELIQEINRLYREK